MPNPAPQSAVESPPAPARPASRSRLIRIAAVAVAILAIGIVGYWHLFNKTYHLAAVHPGVLYRDGNQSPREFRNAIDQVKPRTVVCLVDDREMASSDKPQFAQEAKLLAERGIRLERIPVPLGGWPSTDDVRGFLDIVQRPQNRPVLVHCAQGVRRTGMMAAAYQMSVLGLDRDQAKQSILTFGHSQRTVGDVIRFIDHYDPDRRTTEVFPTTPGAE